jgi:gliding motility-associated-like protein
LPTPVLQEPPTWCTTVENNIFFAFTATSSSVSFTIDVTSCSSGSGLQFQLLTTPDCTDQSFTGISACENVNEGSSVTVGAGGLVPGNVYYLMIDGQAGALCQYSINGSSSINPGPDNICLPSPPVSYSATANVNWSIIPPNAGQIVGSATGTQVSVNWLLPGTHQLCAVNTTCPNAQPNCIDITVGQNVTTTQNVILCQNYDVECAGNIYTAPGTYANFFTGWSGCDSIVNCVVTLQPTVYTNISATLCGPTDYTVCGESFNSTGIVIGTCDNWRGCDSIVTVDLAILEPEAVIAEPDTIGCGANSTVLLNGAFSPPNYAPGGSTTYLWTGPGIVGANNQPLATVNAGGQYCLTVTHGRGNVTCSNTTCVTVISNVAVPGTPTVSGPSPVCSGSVQTYTVAQGAGPTPASYNWTVPAGATFTVVNANTISVNWGTSTGGNVCATATNTCGTSQPGCLPVTVNGPPPLPVVTGPATVCKNNDLQTFTVTNPAPGATYNWTVPTGATFTGSGTSITVNFNGANLGNAQVCVTAQNNCGPSPQGCANFVITGIPNTPVLNGPATVCQNETSVTYSVSNPQTGVNYTWTGPNGAVITGSGTSVTINFNGSGNGQVCVTATNNCGATLPVCQPVQVVPSPVATISGTGEYCQGTTPAIDLTININGVGPWSVIYSNGSTQITIPNIATTPHTLTVSQAGTYTLVSVTNTTSGCTGTVSGSAVVIENPSPTANLSGSGNICQSSGDIVNLNIALTGEAPWNVGWTSGGTPQSPLVINSSPFTLPIGQGLSGNIALTNITDNNSCVGTTSGSASVTVLGAPTTGPVTVLCDPTNTTFTVSFPITGGQPATYSVTPPNGAISNGVFTSNPIPSGSGYSFIVSDANDCNPVTVDDNIHVCDCATMVGVMETATQEICGTGSVTVDYDDANQFFDGNDGLQFILHSGNSFNITPPIIAKSDMPVVTFDPGTMSFGTTYYLSAVVGDMVAGSVDLNDPCLQVAAGTPVVFYDIPDGTIAGGTEICEGEPADLILNLQGESPWTVEINGQSLNVFTSPFTYQVSPTTTTTYNLTSVTDAHCMKALTGSQTIIVHHSPEIAGIQTECNATFTGFTVCVDITGGDPSCYSVTPPNGTLTGSQFCSNEIPSGQGYQFTITDCHNCPIVVAENPLVDCNCVTLAGNMQADMIELCGPATATATYTGGEILDADDTICFILHSGNPYQPIAQSPTATFSFLPGIMNFGQQYFICPVAGNELPNGCVDLGDPCLSIGGCATVVFNILPTAALTGTTAICPGEDATLTVSLTGNGPWSVVYQDNQGAQTTLDIPSSPHTFDVSPSATTTYNLVSVVGGSGCQGTATGAATVSINDSPVISNIDRTCDPSTTFYTVSFHISGGAAASYFVLPPGNLTGNSYTSPPINNNEPYTFIVNDANGCKPDTISGVLDCSCTTDAGTMAPQALEVCVDESVTVPVTTGEVLDSNDVLLYYLHSGNGITLGTVYGTSPTPTFSITSAMQTGVTYYISAVAGNNDGTGGIDLDDICTDIAPGTPVLFNALPTLDISGTATLCEGDETTVTFTVSGQGPMTVTYQIDGVTQPPLPVPVLGNFDVDITPTATTTYTILSILDNGTGCDNTANESVTITVNQPVEAGTSNGDIEVCEGDAGVIALNDQISGADPGGVWVGPDGLSFPTGIADATIYAPGSYEFVYTVMAAAPCPEDEVSFVLNIQPTPVASAGPDQEIDCETTIVTLDGSGSTPGTTVIWSGGTVSDPAAFQPTTTQEGVYTITVETSAGCKDTDIVEVVQNDDLPEPHVSIADVSCFGREDGFIVMDSITNGQPPYLCAFDGGDFTTQKSFINLKPGKHTLTVLDANSCQRTIEVFVGEPAEVKVELDLELEGNENIIKLGDTVNLVVIVSPPLAEMDEVIWTPEGIILCDTCEINPISPTQQTTFTIKVNENGCTDEDDLTVFVAKDRPVYIPNAFSPNGDGPNDKFEIYAGESVTKIKSFLVFNRWGETVFEYYNFDPNDPDGGWDGKHRGELMNPAVFVWFAEIEFVDGKTILYEGDVTLMR